MHSGAARIVTLRMRPMALSERGVAAPTVSLQSLMSGARSTIEGNTSFQLSDYAHEIVHSGFPGLRHYNARPHRAKLDGYLRQIIERDFADGAHSVRRPDMLRRWMVAYAAATGTTTSFEKIREAASTGDGHVPAKTTGLAYRAALERLWIACVPEMDDRRLISLSNAATTVLLAWRSSWARMSPTAMSDISCGCAMRSATTCSTWS